MSYIWKDDFTGLEYLVVNHFCDYDTWYTGCSKYVDDMPHCFDGEQSRFFIVSPPPHELTCVVDYGPSSGSYVYPSQIGVEDVDEFWGLMSGTSACVRFF